MEPTDVKNHIAEYLSSHNIMTLATVTPEGKPLAHTVEYASEGATVYFLSLSMKRKVVNIKNNPHVAYTVDEDYPDWFAIKGVQMEGLATVLTEKEAIDHAAKIYLAKFPFVANFPPDPNMLFLKVTPAVGSYLDYTKGFAHMDTVTF